MKNIRERFIAFEKGQKLQLSKIEENGATEFAEELEFLQFGEWCSAPLAYICKENEQIVIFNEYTQYCGELCQPDFISGDGRINAFFVNDKKEALIIEQTKDGIKQEFIGKNYRINEGNFHYWSKDKEVTFLI